MTGFKSFLLEYLTDEDRRKFGTTKMSAKARKDTDHFFGKKNDKVEGEVSTYNANDHKKSADHLDVEHHLGQEISHEDYRAGYGKDKYGRKTSLGKLIKDDNLRHRFSQDPVREGANTGESSFKTSTHRGIEVAGQTNSKPDALHPNGHSWPTSCKNIDHGINSKYLKPEIKHGTVVHFVHDKKGREIYRATLQPHHDEHGNTMYAVNAEYGIKSPTFTASAHEAAKKLSAKAPKGGIYNIHDEVYDNEHSRNTGILHPEADAASHHDAIKSIGEWDMHGEEKLKNIMKHPNASAEHLTTALQHPNYRVRKAALGHDLTTDDHILHAAKHEDGNVASSIASHPALKGQHLEDFVEKHKDDKGMIGPLSRNKNLTAEHIEKLHDNANHRDQPRLQAHKNASGKWLDQLARDGEITAEGARNINITSPTIQHLAKKLKDSPESTIKNEIAGHKFFPSNLIGHYMKDASERMADGLVNNPKFKPDEHVEQAMSQGSQHVKAAVIRAGYLSGDRIRHEYFHGGHGHTVREAMAETSKTPKEVVDHMIDNHISLHSNLRRHNDVTPEQINRAIDKSRERGSYLLSHRNANEGNISHYISKGGFQGSDARNLTYKDKFNATHAEELNKLTHHDRTSNANEIRHALAHAAMTPSHVLHDIYTHGTDNHKISALEHKNADKELFERGLAERDHDIRSVAHEYKTRRGFE